MHHSLSRLKNLHYWEIFASNRSSLRDASPGTDAQDACPFARHAYQPMRNLHRRRSARPRRTMGDREGVVRALCARGQSRDRRTEGGLACHAAGSRHRAATPGVRDHQCPGAWRTPRLGRMDARPVPLGPVSEDQDETESPGSSSSDRAASHFIRFPCSYPSGLPEKRGHSQDDSRTGSPHSDACRTGLRKFPAFVHRRWSDKPPFSTPTPRPFSLPCTCREHITELTPNPPANLGPRSTLNLNPGVLGPKTSYPNHSVATSHASA